MKYPEQIPDSYQKDFNFSFERGNKSAANLRRDHEHIAERIDKIINSEKFLIDGYPILKQIMMLNPGRKELKLLSKALDRLADLADQSHSIVQKLTVFKVAEEDPNWLRLAFGDYQNEIDSDIEKLFSQED